MNIKQSHRNYTNNLTSLEYQVLNKSNKVSSKIKSYSTFKTFGTPDQIFKESKKYECINIVFKNKSNQSFTSNLTFNSENKNQSFNECNNNVGISFCKNSRQFKSLNLNRNKLNGEILSGIVKEDNEYNIFEEILLIKMSLLEFEDMIVNDFQLKKSTIIIAFIYFDLFLNRSSIILSKLIIKSK